MIKHIHYVYYLLVTCLIINIFLKILVNDTSFSNLKLNFIIIAGFIFSSKYVKQINLINYSWISPNLQREWGFEFCLFFKKWGGYISPKKLIACKNSKGSVVR